MLQKPSVKTIYSLPSFREGLHKAVLGRLGRGIWRKWSGYHSRALVETKIHCFKRLGEWVMARTLER